MQTRRQKITAVVCLLVIAAAGLVLALEWRAHRLKTQKYTVEDRLKQYGQIARARLTPHFQKAGVEYPPKHITMVGLKQEKQLQIYAAGTDGKLRFIRSYPILAASGGPGPKLRYGDGQVPEGIYPITFLNPNSSYHLSVRVGYPNDFDKAMAHRDGRDNLGGDIMIHGQAVSIGCLAMGDEASEDIFVLTADTGIENTKLILSPCDFRSGAAKPHLPTEPKWLSELYDSIESELGKLPPR